MPWRPSSSMAQKASTSPRQGKTGHADDGHRFVVLRTRAAATRAPALQRRRCAQRARAAWDRRTSPRPANGMAGGAQLHGPSSPAASCRPRSKKLSRRADGGHTQHAARTTSATRRSLAEAGSTYGCGSRSGRSFGRLRQGAAIELAVGGDGQRVQARPARRHHEVEQLRRRHIAHKAASIPRQPRHRVGDQFGATCRVAARPPPRTRTEVGGRALLRSRPPRCGSRGS